MGVNSQLELESIPLSVCEEVDKAVSLHTIMAKKKQVALISEIDIAQPLRLGTPSTHPLLIVHSRTKKNEERRRSQRGLYALQAIHSGFDRYCTTC